MSLDVESSNRTRIKVCKSTVGMKWVQLYFIWEGSMYILYVDKQD
jgi:hypothetical protein